MMCVLSLVAVYSIFSNFTSRSTAPHYYSRNSFGTLLGTVVSPLVIRATWYFRWMFSRELMHHSSFLCCLTGNVGFEPRPYSPSVVCYHYTTFPLSLLSHLFSIYIIAKNFYFCKYFSHLLSSSQGVLLLPMSWREVGLHLP